MANLNINTGAPGNPLDALLQQNGGGLYGSQGFDIENLLAQARAGTIDPRLAALGYGPTTYDSTYQFNPSNSMIDPTTGQINLNGQRYVQLKNTSIGGPGGVIDPSKVIYNKQFGELAPSNDVNKPQDDWAANYMPFIIAGLGSAAAIAGSAGAAGGVGDISTSDLGSLGTVGGEGAPAAAGAAGSAGAAGATGATSSSGLLGGLGDSASGLLGQAGTWAMHNPLQALGLLQTGAGLLGSHRSSGNSGGSSKGGSGSGAGNGFNVQQQFYTNPTTLAQLQRYQAGGY